MLGNTCPSVEGDRMGMLDRDYSADRDYADYRPSESSAVHWLWILPLVAIVLTITIGPPSWLPVSIAVRVHQVREHLRLEQPSSVPSRPGRDVLSLGGGQAVTDPPRQAPPQPAIARCLINGQVVEIASGYCPPEPVRAPPPPAPVARAVEAQENPFVKPGTIYRCRSYSGGFFWAQAHCSQHKALIDRIASVPVGMPFQQQVDVAEGERSRFESQLRSEQREDQRRVVCASLRIEREQIWKRSGSGSGYTPIEQLGADQTRWRQIQSQLASNNCGA
jgi:hypothetical protein